jgi:hypothetical protein
MRSVGMALSYKKPQPMIWVLREFFGVRFSLGLGLSITNNQVFLRKEK